MEMADRVWNLIFQVLDELIKRSLPYLPDFFMAVAFSFVSGLFFGHFIDQLEAKTAGLELAIRQQEKRESQKEEQNPRVVEQIKLASKRVEKAKIILEGKLNTSGVNYRLGCKAIWLRWRMENTWRDLSRLEASEEMGGRNRLNQHGNEELKELEEKGYIRGKEECVSTSVDSDRGLTSSDQILDELWELLREESIVGFVGVLGMGGVGRAKLLHDLAKRFSERGHTFKLIIIQVGKHKNPHEGIQKEICDLLEMGNISTNTKERARDIFRHLTTEKKCVIFLDNVWCKISLSSIGIPNPEVYAHCCKVVQSTCIANLCRDAQKIIELKCLERDESLTLFQDSIGKNLDSAIRERTTTIVGKCEGLPLDVVYARQLCSSEGWEKAERILTLEPWNESRMQDDGLAVLRSYNNLSRRQRITFLYHIHTFCSKETSSSRWKRITGYLIGEGILGESDTLLMDEVHSKRDRLMVKLQDAGLLDMGNMVHAMAFWVGIGTKDWLALSEDDVIDRERAEKWKSAKRISIMDSNITALYKEPNWPHLKALLLTGSMKGRSLHKTFFRLMTSLKVLDLSSSSLEEFPTSICQISTLGYLNMSSSKIESLPKCMSKMQKLKFLSLEKCLHLKIIPRGVFSRLSNLMVLRMGDTFSRWGMDKKGAEIEELSDLKHLLELEITIENMATLRALVTIAHLQASIVSVNLRYLRGTETLQLPQDLGQHMKRLQQLSISDCPDLKELVLNVSEGEGSIENLLYLHLGSLELLTKITWTGRRAIKCFTKLKELRITECEQIVEPIVEDRVAAKEVGRVLSAFPALQVLHLVKLTGLKSICRRPLRFPSLKELRVDSCPSLRGLPFGPNSGRSLSKIEGSRKWWNSLEWGSSGEALRRYFASKWFPCDDGKAGRRHSTEIYPSTI